MNNGRQMPLYQLFMLVLCVFALTGIILQHVYAKDGEISEILDIADLTICAAFAIDFLISLATAQNRWKYLLTWGWLDLLSSIPILPSARWGRIARIARIMRVLRSVRAARMLSSVILSKRRESTVLAAILLAIVLVFASSTAILHFENVRDANITTADDALWWAFATITTVGYGERYPVTPEGRVIAAILMTAGIGLFGAFSASLAAWFLVPADQATDAEIAGLRDEVKALREVIERIAPHPPSPSVSEVSDESIRRVL